MVVYKRTFSFLGWPPIAVGGLQLAASDMDTVLAAALAGGCVRPPGEAAVS